LIAVVPLFQKCEGLNNLIEFKTRTFATNGSKRKHLRRPLSSAEVCIRRLQGGALSKPELVGQLQGGA
jgi:hypothetical protein